MSQLTRTTEVAPDACLDEDALLAPSGSPLARAPRELFARAQRARLDGRHRAAIAGYRAVLVEAPGHVEAEARLAPLLAERGQRFEAWRLFSDAARRLLRQRRPEEALATFREACLHLPQEFEAWRLRAELELKLGRPDAAFETLLEGRQCFRSVHGRDQAIALLQMARLLEPDEPEVLLDLADLLIATDRGPEAAEILFVLGLRSRGALRRRVRFAQLRARPGLRAFGRFLHAVFAEWRGRGTSCEDDRLPEYGESARYL